MILQIDTADAGLGPEGHGCGVLRQLRQARAVFLLGQHDDAAALRRLVGEGRHQRGIDHFLFGMAAERDERDRLAVAQRDRAGLVQQQVLTSPAASMARPDMAMTLR